MCSLQRLRFFTPRHFPPHSFGGRGSSCFLGALRTAVAKNRSISQPAKVAVEDGGYRPRRFSSATLVRRRPQKQRPRKMLSAPSENDLTHEDLKAKCSGVQRRVIMHGQGPLSSFSNSGSGHGECRKTCRGGGGAARSLAVAPSRLDCSAHHTHQFL